MPPLPGETPTSQPWMEIATDLMLPDSNSQDTEEDRVPVHNKGNLVTIPSSLTADSEEPTEAEDSPDNTSPSSSQPCSKKKEEEDETDPDAILAASLADMTMGERTTAQEELHGVLEIIGEEPAFVEKKLSELATALAERLSGRATQSEKEAYEAAIFHHGSYTETAAFRIRFLRAERFEAAAAATRLLRYLAFVREYFGVEALGRPLALSDLDADSQTLLRSGKLQFLRSRDTAGRAILCDTHTSADQLVPTGSAGGNALFYMMCTAADDPETSRKGIVGLIYHIGDFGIPFNQDAQYRPYQVIRAMPIRLVGIHFCLSNTLLTSMCATVMHMLGHEFARKCRIHRVSSHLECRHALLGFGIPVDLIPATESGALKTKEQRQWIRRRRVLETGLETKGSFAGIELPSSQDALGGRGKNLVKHPGNQLLLECLEAHALGETTTLQAKLTACKSALQDFRTKAEWGGRFLEREQDGFWYEVSEERARFRVEKGLRNLQEKIRRRKQPLQEMGGVEGPPKKQRFLLCTAPTCLD